MGNYELTHHGIKGMRWGVRRYQNPDGTLTAKGKKRYADEMNKLKEKEKILKNKQRAKAKIDQLLKKRQELDNIEKSLKNKSKSTQDAPESTTKKPSSNSSSTSRLPDVKSLSDSELNSLVTRLKNEQQYKKYVRDAEKEQISRGKKFVDKVLNDVIVPAAVEVGKNMAKDILSDFAKKATKK